MYFYPSFSKNLVYKREKVLFNSITGNNVQMLYLRLEDGESTYHTHENEQIGFILSGEVELTINNETRVCKSGDGYYIPGNVSHGFKVECAEGVNYIEVYCPIKEENKK